VLAEDEGTGDEADEEGEEVGDHGVIRWVRFRREPVGRGRRESAGSRR
jgi:hypothetical protein